MGPGSKGREKDSSSSKYHIYIFQGFRSSQAPLSDDGHEKRGKLEIYISRMKRFEQKSEEKFHNFHVIHAEFLKLLFVYLTILLGLLFGLSSI